MLDHLINYDPPPAFLDQVVSLDKAEVQSVIDAQHNTAQWLKQMGAPDTDSVTQEVQEETARNTFAVLTSDTADSAKKAQLVKLKAPTAVQHLVGMLTAYDWDFVQQAQEIRGYAVSQLVEETKHPDARIRLRALELLGRVTEIALFTDRVEVKKTEMADHELEARIREKLAKFLPAEDAVVVDAVEVTPTPANDETA